VSSRITESYRDLLAWPSHQQKFRDAVVAVAPAACVTIMKDAHPDRAAALDEHTCP
jgi:hypothetical protein